MGEAVKAHLEIERVRGIDRREISNDGVASGSCPGCDVHPFRIVTPPPEDGRAGGKCVACGDNVGFVYVTPDTIFGEEEDRNMLELSRARVYR